MATNPSQGKLPVLRIENLAAGQKNIPFTFGQVFKVGAFKAGQGLAGQLPNGDLVPLQVDQKATHADGSIRHAIISGVLPTIFEKEERELKLVPAQAGTAKPLPMAHIPDGVVEITVDGTKYSTNGSKFGNVIEWLSGPVVVEGIVTAELLDPDGKPHPHLTVQAGIRAYSIDKVRVEVVLENTKTFTPGARNYTYDVAVKIGGNTVFEQKALTHYHHARWRQVFWVGEQPAIQIKHDGDYIIRTSAAPNYDRTAVPTEKALADLAKTAKAGGMMQIGPLNKYMPTSGGRDDIGPLPMWTVMWLLSMDKRAEAEMMAVAEGAASWSIHYRDENTGYPVRTDGVNAKISTHMNLNKKGPLPVPRFAPSVSHATPYTHDTAHQPSMSYVPYLVTGDYYHLEELQFWATQNTTETDPSNSGNGQGLVRWQQLRGQAWSLRTLGQAAYITPDAHPLKEYFNKQVDNNLAYYHDVFVVKNPNNLGAYDGTGAGMERKDESSPWQDDFFTWSLGYLVELGFDKAAPVLQWKAKYSVGRMTAPGYCWIQGSTYYLRFRDTASGPVYDSFAQVYDKNFNKKAIWLEGKTPSHPKGLNYIDQPCGSQEQADWLTSAYGKKWPLGQMVGHASSVIGYPANMQPALAVAIASGVPNANEAWDKFESRTTKPDYRTGPQWAIIPREVDEAVEEPAESRTAVVISVVAEEDGVLHVEQKSIVAGKKYTVVILEE